LLDVCKHSREGVDICVDIAEDGEEGVFRFRYGIFFLGLTTEDTERRRCEGDANSLSWMITNAPVSFSSSVISVSSVVNFSVLGCLFAHGCVN
jgi:hypothetical protein